MTDEQRTQMIYEIHQEREAYDNAVGLVSIAQVLEIIDRVGNRAEVGDMDAYEVYTEIRFGVLSLQGGDKE